MGPPGQDARGLDRAEHDTGAPHWAERLAHSRLGMGVLSFGESTVVPIPLETLMVPLMVAYPARAWVLALVALIGALAGASVMYFAGAFAYEGLRSALGGVIDFAPAEDFIAKLEGSAAFWSIFLVAVGPLPLQMATLGAGAAQVNFAVYISAIGLSRGIRYFGLALICRLVGERIAHLNLRRRTMVLFSAAFLLGCWGLYELFLSAD